MKNFTLLSLVGLVSMGSLAGCGGSSSGSSEGGGENLVREEQPRTNALSVPNYAPQTIDEDSAESVVQSVYQHLRYIAWDTVPTSDSVPNTFSPDQLVQEFTETDTFDLSEFICTDYGSFRIKVLEGRPELDAEEDLYFGPGDKFAATYDNCAGEDTTLPGYTREGSTTVEVLEGYVGLFGGSATASTVVNSVSDKSGFVSDGELVGYVHGDMKTVREPERLSVSGSSHRRNPANNRFLEYYLGNYSLTFEKAESATSYERWRFSSDSEFLFGLKSLGGYYRTVIQDVVYTDNQLDSGVITLSDDHNSLRIALFPTHLTYELDLDGDGVYEIDRMLNRGEF